MSVNRPLATTSELAAYLQLPPRTLDTWARQRTGPRFAKVGRHRRYRWADIEKWLDQQAKAAA